MTPPSTITRSGRAPAEYRPARSSGRSRSVPRSPRRVVAARRRRRLWQLAVAAGVVALLVVLTLPAAKRAVTDEFGLPLRYAPTIRAQAAQKHVPASLIAAVIYAETKFQTGITSATGAEGPMQVEPGTALYLAHQSGATAFTTADLQHPATNIAYGSYYLRELLTHYDGSELLAVAAYNGGRSNVDAWEATALAHGHRLRVDEIPFPQTRAYVAKVLSAQRRYRHVYARQLGYG